MLLPLLIALPLMAQEFDTNFDKMLFEINRSRYDKALHQLFPLQAHIRSKLDNKPIKVDETVAAQMGQMRNTTAVLSTIALLRTQVESNQFEQAQVQAMLVGMGLSGLWAELPAYQRLNFAKEDLAQAISGTRPLELRKLAYAAVDAEDWQTARSASVELIALVESKDYKGGDPGTLKHSALTVRGLADLAKGDIAAAEKAIVDSMRVRTEELMRLSGPSFRLAIELLAKGRRTAVDQFLILVSESTWRDSSKAGEWRKELAAGKTPDFPRFSSN